MKPTLLALLLLAASPAFAAQPEPVYPGDNVTEQTAPVTETDHRTVTIGLPDGGGSVDEFYTMYQRWNDSGASLRIDAPCISACTFFLAFIEDNDPRVCITKRGSLGVHEISSGDTSNPTMSQAYYRWLYPDWVLQWINDHGGLKEDVKFIYPEDMEGHILMCDGAARPSIPVDKMIEKTDHGSDDDMPPVRMIERP